MLAKQWKVSVIDGDKKCPNVKKEYQDQKTSEAMKNNKNGALYTVKQVKEIRRLHETENMGYTEISELMHIPRPAVYLIATYRRWKEV